MVWNSIPITWKRWQADGLVWEDNQRRPWAVLRSLSTREMARQRKGGLEDQIFDEEAAEEPDVGDEALKILRGFE